MPTTQIEPTGATASFYMRLRLAIGLCLALSVMLVLALATPASSGPEQHAQPSSSLSRTGPPPLAHQKAVATAQSGEAHTRTRRHSQRAGANPEQPQSELLPRSNDEPPASDPAPASSITLSETPHIQQTRATHRPRDPPARS